jgi:hypothetical protein
MHAVNRCSPALTYVFELINLPARSVVMKLSDKYPYQELFNNCLA